MGKIPPGYSVTKIRHIDPAKWYAIDLRKPHNPHLLPLIMDNYQLAKRWLISQKFYLPDQVQLIAGRRALGMGLFIEWSNLPFLAIPHKYPTHTGFGNSKKDWKESFRKEIKAVDEGKWKRITQYTFRLANNYYVIYTWKSKNHFHMKRIIKGIFSDKQLRVIRKRIKEGPKEIDPRYRWISGHTQNPSPIAINRFNQEHGLPPLDRFPFDGHIALRWRGFVQEYAPLPDEYLEPIT